MVAPSFFLRIDFFRQHFVKDPTLSHREEMKMATIEATTTTTKTIIQENVLKNVPFNQPHLPCHLCDQAFYQSAERMRHIQQFHEIEGKNEQCIVCGARFFKKNQMRKHISKAHGKNLNKGETSEQEREAIKRSTPYACTYDSCEKKFATEGQLKKHLARHEQMTFLCGYPNCGSMFAFRKEMQQHIQQCHKYKSVDDQEREHVGFRCPLCSENQKSFATLTLLQQHLSDCHAQEEEKLLRCPYDGCMKMYTRQSNLNTHIRTAHGTEEEKYRFSCELCDKRFYHKRSLNRHILAEHEGQKRKRTEGKENKEEAVIKKKMKRDELRSDKLLKQLFGSVPDI